MTKLIRKLLYVLPASNQQIASITLLFVLSSILEVFGIGIVGPFIQLATQPELVQQNLQLRNIYNTLNFTSDHVFVASLGVTVITVFFIKSAGAWFTQAYIARFSNEQQRLLINKTIAAYLKAPYIYLTQKNSASIVDSALEIANTFTLGILSPLLTSISNAFVIIALLILLSQAEPAILIVILAVFLPLLAFINLSKEPVQAWGKTTRQSKEQIITLINHAFGGIKETKTIGCEDYFNTRLENHTEQLKESHCNFVAFNILPRYLVESVMILCVIGMMVAFLLTNQDTETLFPALGVYALASIRVLPAVSNTVASLSVLRNSSFTIEKIYDDIRTLEDLVPQEQSFRDSQTSTTPDLSFERVVALRNVSFQYPQASEYALEDINLEIPKGSSIAFIGRSGAGKTTLVDIILGLLTPQYGEITVDGINIQDNVSDWQRLLGYIPQSIFLTDDTLASNIAFGVPEREIDYQRLEEAVETAQLADVVTRLPQGLKTVVGERGVMLSGGQRQRVGIARALYRNCEILILDEATSALDNETEKLVTDAISVLSGRKTLITIAHRLSTVRSCDRIYSLEKGRIIKVGTFEEVVGLEQVIVSQQPDSSQSGCNVI